MKFKNALIYFSIIFMFFLSTTNVSASEKVKIKSIDLEDKSLNTTEIEKASFNGLEMNFNVKFKALNDYAKYRIIIENKEDKDYKLSIDTSFQNSKYILYKYDNTDVVKANSDTTLYVTISYNKQVDDNNYISDKYTENNSMVIKLSNDNVTNPQTSNNVYFVIISLIFMGVVLLLIFGNKKNIKLNIIVLFIFLSLPVLVKAVEYLKITINSDVYIEKGYSVDYEVAGFIKESDLDNYDLTYAECPGYVYVGDESENNRYKYCRYAIYKVDKIYSASEQVSIELPKILYFPYERKQCKYNDGSPLLNDISSILSNATYDGSKKIICESASLENSAGASYYYEYNKYFAKKFGYTVNDDDNIVMKFTNADDEWSSRGYFNVFKETNFIMPNHDVLFTYPRPN